MKLKLEQVGKRFNYDWIFRDIHLSFSTQKKYAVLGPNGSGKSTFLKVLSGHLTPSKGTITFWDQQDRPVSVNEVYQQLSYAAPYIDLIEEFTLLEAIQFHCRFKPFYQNMSAEDLVDILNFKAYRDKQVRFFSSGMKQRLKLALAICSDTQFLLLDEPTSNLDLQGIDWYRDLVQTYSKDRLIIIASNAEVDYNFCDEYIQITDYKKKKKK